MRKILSIDVINDREEFIGVSDDGLLWFGKLREASREQAHEFGVDNQFKAGDKFIEWTALNGPKDGDPPWRKKLPFWDRMEKKYGPE